MSEEVLWKGSPSQILNLGKYILALIITAALVVGGFFPPMMPLWFLTVFPLGWMLWQFLTVRCDVYEVTTERLRIYKGVLKQTMDDVELYRVKDSSIEKPFWYRIAGLSTVILETSDRGQPHIEMKAIRNGMDVREMIRKQVETLRDSKRVREVDFDENASGHDHGDGVLGDHDLTNSGLHGSGH